MLTGEMHPGSMRAVTGIDYGDRFLEKGGKATDGACITAEPCRSNAALQAVTLGQYLAPTPEHYPVVEYIKLKVYEELTAEAEALGFRVAAGPLVRSSYQAGAMLRPAAKV